MTTSDLDVYRSAKLMIDQHGDAALFEAAMKADEMVKFAENRANNYQAIGDFAEERVWRKIAEAIKYLLADEGS